MSEKRKSVMDSALTGLISCIKGVLSRDARSVSAEPTQGSAFLNDQVLIMKVSEPTPDSDTEREGSVSLLSLPLENRDETGRFIT